MLLTQEQLNQRLNSQDNLLNLKDSTPTLSTIAGNEVEADEAGEISPEVSSAKIIKWGGNSTVPREHYKLNDEQRVTIGALGNTFAPKEVATITGVSVDCVRDLRNGKKGSSGYNQTLAEAVDRLSTQNKKNVQDRAVEKLLSTLGFITEDKVRDLKAMDAAQVASNLSRVVSNLEPKEKASESSARVQVILYQPPPMKETHFEMIEV